MYVLNFQYSRICFLTISRLTKLNAGKSRTRVFHAAQVQLIFSCVRLVPALRWKCLCYCVDISISNPEATLSQPFRYGYKTKSKFKQLQIQGWICPKKWGRLHFPSLPSLSLAVYRSTIGGFDHQISRQIEHCYKLFKLEKVCERCIRIRNQGHSRRSCVRQAVSCIAAYRPARVGYSLTCTNVKFEVNDRVLLQHSVTLYKWILVPKSAVIPCKCD